MAVGDPDAAHRRSLVGPIVVCLLSRAARLIENPPHLIFGKRGVVDSHIGNERIGRTGHVGAADEETVDAGTVRYHGVQRLAHGRPGVGNAGTQSAVEIHVRLSGTPRKGHLMPVTVKRWHFPRAVAVAGIRLVGAQPVAPPPEPQGAGTDATGTWTVRHRSREHGAPRMNRGLEIPLSLRPEQDRPAIARQVPGGGIGQNWRLVRLLPCGAHPQRPRSREPSRRPLKALGDERSRIPRRRLGDCGAVKGGGECQPCRRLRGGGSPLREARHRRKYREERRQD